MATIHDAVPFRYPNPDEKRREHVQGPFLRSARSASRIIAVSEFGRSEVHEALGVELERIAVIPHGVEREFSPGAAVPLPRELQGQRYLLFVGDPQAEPRKNFPLLYEAYRRAWPDGDGPLLAVAAAQAPAVPGVVATGVFGGDIAGNDATLVACYRGARALALASYHETFGMPMLEAMACGTPVAASHASSLPEVGGDAALYAPPDDADAWAASVAAHRGRCGAARAARRGGTRARGAVHLGDERGAARRGVSRGGAMIRLGVDAWNLPGDRRGIGRYLRSILREWWNGASDRVEVTLIVPEWHTWTVRGRYLREVDGREYRVVSRALHGRAGLDALWFPFNGCSWTNFSLPATATLHDASNFVVPDYAPQTQAIFRAAAQKCRALITDSHFAQAELARVLGIAPERLVPIALGVDPPRDVAAGFAGGGGDAALRFIRGGAGVAQRLRHLARGDARGAARAAGFAVGGDGAAWRGRGLRQRRARLGAWWSWGTSTTRCWRSCIASARCSRFPRVTRASGCRCSRR